MGSIAIVVEVSVSWVEMDVVGDALTMLALSSSPGKDDLPASDCLWFRKLSPEIPALLYNHGNFIWPGLIILKAQCGKLIVAGYQAHVLYLFYYFQLSY